MSFKTADLCDRHEGRVSVVAPIFRAYGGTIAFSGAIATVKVFEDNVLVREALGREGRDRVLVVDGGGSLRCALVGDQLAAMGHRNGWAGIVVWGCIRDSQAISEMPIGIRALGTHPLRSVKQGAGHADVPVCFGDVRFVPGHHLYADEDGIVVAETALA